jgi:hypothetical protein
MDVRRWFGRVFGDCLKGRRDDEAYVDWVHYGGKPGVVVALTPVASVNISPVRLQPCAPAFAVATPGDEEAQDPLLWTETNRLVNAAAAWQIRRVMPVEVNALDESTLSKITSPQLAKRFKDVLVLAVLRADNEMLRQLPLELLSSESFMKLTLLERRAIHNVLAQRPTGWTEAQLSLYESRERELIAAAEEDPYGVWSYDPLYSERLPFEHSTYAQEPRGWDD